MQVLSQLSYNPTVGPLVGVLPGATRAAIPPPARRVSSTPLRHRLPPSRLACDEARAYCSRVNAFVSSIRQPFRAPQFGHDAPMPRRVWVTLMLIAFGLAGCSSQSTSTPESSAAGSPMIEADCHRVDMRTPTGEPLDLTGRWRTSLGSYYLAQDQSCLFWMGQSAPQGDHLAAGELWTNVFSGQISSDFVVAGPWSDVPTLPDATAHSGRLELGIEFFEQDDVTWPSLRQRSQEPANLFGDWAWQPEASLSDLTTMVGTVGIDDEVGWCSWIEVDGVRYELTGNVEVQGTHVFDLAEATSVGVGETARVEGWIAQALIGDCEATGVLVRILEPAP